MPAPSTRNDPFKNFNFLVEIDGIPPAAFKSVSGLSAEVELIEYRSGADTLTSTRKLPGRVRYANVTLTPSSVPVFARTAPAAGAPPPAR